MAAKEGPQAQAAVQLSALLYNSTLPCLGAQFTSAATHQAYPCCPPYACRMTVRLAVAGAFHTDFMAPAREKLQEALASTAIQVGGMCGGGNRWALCKPRQQGYLVRRAHWPITQGLQAPTLLLTPSLGCPSLLHLRRRSRASPSSPTWTPRRTATPTPSRRSWPRR